jgi:mRNA interferase YafQ
MTSKKPAQQKRANLPRSSDSAKQFHKDWERLSHSGRYDLRRLKEAMLLLIANEGPLPPESRDHELAGDWKGFREATSAGISCSFTSCARTARSFSPTGTHADLFE